MIISGTRLVGGRYETNGMVTAGLTMWLDAGTYPGSGTTWSDLSGNGAGNLLNGHIAQALIYDRTLSPGEVLQNFNGSRARYSL